MKRRNSAAKIALCAVLAAAAVSLMFLGGAIPFASIAAPVLASLVLIPVYAECGQRWGLLWFLAVTVLSALLAPQKECAVLFAFFGYYPILKKWFGRIRSHVLQWLIKLLYLNVTVFAAYALMLYVFQLSELIADFDGIKTWMLAAMLLLANATFVIYNVLIDRIEIVYYVRLRPKLKF